VKIARTDFMRPPLFDSRIIVLRLTTLFRLARRFSAGISSWSALPALLCVLCGCATAPGPTPRAQIESVFAQRTELKVAYLVRDRQQHLIPNPKRYAEEIKRIEVGRCPEDFQSAWFNYVVALERAHINDDKIDFTKLGKYVAAAAVAEAHPLAAFGILANPGATSRQKHLEECLEDAWYGLERIAMNYGVKTER
jgi:hypothetical protein